MEVLVVKECVFQSQNPDLNLTHQKKLSTWLSFLSFNCTARLHCAQNRGFGSNHCVWSHLIRSATGPLSKSMNRFKSISCSGHYPYNLKTKLILNEAICASLALFVTFPVLCDFQITWLLQIWMSRRVLSCESVGVKPNSHLASLKAMVFVTSYVLCFTWRIFWDAEIIFTAGLYKLQRVFQV